MTYYSFLVPREIFYGPGALEALGTVPGKRAFIITDQTIRSLGLLSMILRRYLRMSDKECSR